MNSELLSRINELSVTLVRPFNSLVAFGSLVYADEWYFGHIGLHLTQDGDLRCAFPDKTMLNGKRMNVYFPIKKEVEEAVRASFSKKYFEMTK